MLEVKHTVSSSTKLSSISNNPSVISVYFIRQLFNCSPAINQLKAYTHTHTQPFYGRLGFCRLSRWAGTRKV